MTRPIQRLSDLDPLTLPLCARCGRPVERAVSWADPVSARQIFEFHCHGETERVELNDEWVVDDRVRWRGVCFENQPAALAKESQS